MRLLYTKPILNDLSQGSRISFVRQIRKMTQDNLAELLGIKGENRRKAITRYEKGRRNPKEYRIKEMSKILHIDELAIKQYDFKDSDDIIYFLLWIEELIPNIYIDVYGKNYIRNKQQEEILNFLDEWNMKKNLRNSKQISYGEYIEWKFNKMNEGDDDE